MLSAIRVVSSVCLRLLIFLMAVLIPACASSSLAFSTMYSCAQLGKNLPAIRKTWVGSLGLEDSLEKGMVTHSRILAWRIPWIEGPGRLQSMSHEELDTTERLSTHT